MDPVVARTTAATVLALVVGTAGCSSPNDASAASSTVDVAVQDCRAQWDDVAANLVSLDQDPRPSALARRWENVVATVSIYQQTETADRCQENIETLTTGITQLRQFTVRLRPFDMEYQSDQVADEVADYLAEPLPAPVRRGTSLVRPPTKKAVAAALARLTDQDAAANADLDPPWGQLESVELTDSTAVENALGDLTLFARASPSWLACSQALKVLRTALAARAAAS